MGTRSQQIDVYLKYIGSFDAPDTRTQEEIEAERVEEEKLEARRNRQREYARRKAAEKRTGSVTLHPMSATGGDGDSEQSIAV